MSERIQANQRTAITNVESARWVYTYDSLGQVVSGKKYWADGTPVAGQQFEYGFDDIGNRKNTSAGGDQLGANLRPASYTNNLLNQITSRDVPGYVNVLGSAKTNATVSLWSPQSTAQYAATTRKGEYYRGELPLNNSTGAVWMTITNLAVLNNGSNPDIVTNTTGNVFVSKTAEVFQYDRDGNLTNDGRWTYTWDAENRLTAMTSLSSAPAGSKRKVEFAYDSKSRRIQKISSTWNGSSYVAQSTNRFVYDGWNLIAILNPQSSILQSFTWGLDLSGSLQGAGGVGGLLAVNDAANGAHYCAYDGNGNPTALMKATDSAVMAYYEYGPFGETLRLTGATAKTNPFRFSTKYQDDETDLLYYGYRSYNPSVGKWLSRDPIGELAFRNHALRRGMLSEASRSLRTAKNLESDENLHYVFVANAPINHIDYLGLQTGCWHCGRAIDHALRLTLVDVVKRFDNLSLWGKIKACAPIWVPVPGFDMAWDMNKITWDWGADMGCGNEKTCNGTVTVVGGCYDAWDVNFMSYGWAARLCGMPFGDFLAHVAGWKFIKPFIADDGDGNDWERPGQWGAFAIAGYNFSFSPPAPPTTLTACKACDKRTPYPNHLDSEWP